MNSFLRIELKKSPLGYRYKIYIFKCLYCSNEIKSKNKDLKNHSGKCQQCNKRLRPYEHILNEIKGKTKRDFNIEYVDFINIIKDKKCHYCNKTLIYNIYSRQKGIRVNSNHQLDRKDNNLGYTKNNVVPCCWECNRLKSDIYTYEEFMKLSPILTEIENKRIK